MRCGSVWVLFAAVAGAACTRSDVPPPLARNLVLLSIDTLRSDHVGAYGGAQPTSPNLDHLSGESVLFARMRAHAPETRDSHMSVFTSQYPFVHRRVGALPTLAEGLRGAGFATAAFTDGGEVSHAFGFDRGFELYGDQGGGLDKHVAAFESWFDTRKPERFFVFFHTYEVHDPYHPGPPFESMFFPEYQGSVTGEDSQRLLQSIRQIGIFRHGDHPIPVLTEADRRQMVALYDGGIRKTDEAVGRLVELLRRRHLLEDTIVFVMSDHGDEFWDHGSVLHAHTLYEELLDVVGILRLPHGLGAGRIRWSLTRGIDVTPTLLRLLGAEPLPSAVGRAFDPLAEESDRPHYAEKRSNFSITLGRHKFIGELGAERTALYDLLADPREQKPLKDPALNAKLLGEIGEVRSGIKRDLTRYRELYPPRPNEALDTQTLEQLRRLGYIE
jgi:arylsulfatase A-like enzyme